MAATASPTNAFQAIALQQEAESRLNPTERLFRDALSDVLRTEGQKDTKLLQRLQSLRDEDSMKTALEKELQASRFFGPTAPDHWTRKIDSVADHIWDAREYVDKFCQINQTATMPIWGPLLFVVMVLRNIPALEDLFKQFDKRMEVHLATFKEHFMPDPDYSKSLRNALKAFYACIIRYCVKVTPWLKASFLKVYCLPYTNKARDGLVSLLRELEETARQVHDAANAGGISEIKNLRNAQIEADAMRTAPSQPAKIESIPWRLTPTFTGRETVLRMMRDMLGGFEDGRPQEVAVWGLPGAGKTQTTLQLAKDFNPHNAPPSIYSHVICLRANNKDSLGSEIRRVMLRIEPKSPLLQTAPIPRVTERFHVWLEANEKWLLIFDDVKDVNDTLAFSPQRGRGHVVYSTRSKATAVRLGRDSKAIEMQPMNETDGAKLVQNLLAVDWHEGLQKDAKETTNFCRGLPLAIEGLVNLALKNGQPLAEVLASAKDKAALLKQRPGNTFHEDNASVGAILVNSLDALRSKYPRAHALFLLMAYREPSSIPIATITTSDVLDTYFARPETYDRGVIRTPEGSARRKRWLDRPTIDLLDYDPFEKEIWQRLFHLGDFKPKFWKPDLPRIDSSDDIALQNYWVNNRALRDALADRAQLDSALNQLEDSGLIRRLQEPKDNFWIHDLYAELATAYTADLSKELNQNASHLAATTVFLSLPTPERRLHARLRLSVGLPHAEMALRHLRESGIFNNTTIGPELAHLVASTIHMDSWKVADDDDRAKIVELYRLAFWGYFYAWQRLLEHPDLKRKKDKGQEKIWIATLTDRTREDNCQHVSKGAGFWRADRYLFRYERPGSSAPWRTLAAASKLGMALVEQGEKEEGIKFAEMGRSGIEAIFGNTHEESEFTRGFLIYLNREAGMWENVLKICDEELAVWATRSADYYFGTCLPTMICEARGLAFEELKMWQKAVGALKTNHDLHKNWYGVDSRICIGPVVKLARCYAKQGNWELSLLEWFEVFRLMFRAADCPEDEYGWKEVAVEDTLVDEYIEEFEVVKGEWRRWLREEGRDLEPLRGWHTAVEMLEDDVEKWRGGEGRRRAKIEEKEKEMKENGWVMTEDMRKLIRGEMVFEWVC